LSFRCCRLKRRKFFLGGDVKQDHKKFLVVDQNINYFKEQYLIGYFASSAIIAAFKL
jgi:hypothetical protein